MWSSLWFSLAAKSLYIKLEGAYKVVISVLIFISMQCVLLSVYGLDFNYLWFEFQISNPTGFLKPN